MFKVNNENTRTTSKATRKTGIIFIVGTIGTTPPFKNSLHPFESLLPFEGPLPLPSLEATGKSALLHSGTDTTP